MRKVLFVVCCMLLLSCRLHGEQRTSEQAPVAQYVTGKDFLQALHLIDSTFKAENQDIQQLRLLCQDCASQIEAERFKSRVALTVGVAALALSCIVASGMIMR